MRHLVEEMTTFAMVAKTNSFTQAAKQLGKSKTYVSLQVSRLEEAIGLQLLFRTTRHLELTEAGQRYVDYCNQILNTVDEASKAVESLKGSMLGTIKLSVPVSLGGVFLDGAISAFQSTYPDIQIQLELHNSIKNLKEERLDMAVRIASQLDEDLVAIRIGDLKTVICASPNYLSQYGYPKVPTDLIQHNVILHSQVDSDSHWPLMIDEDLHRIRVSWKISINNFLLIREAALSGKGLARLPSYLVKEDVLNKQLEAILTSYPAPSQPIYLVYDYQGVLPLKNRVFIDFLKAWFAEHTL